MNKIEVNLAESKEYDWIVNLFVNSEPWITFGLTPEKCMTTCNDTQYHVYIAKSGSINCGAIIVHPLGLASSPYIKSIAVAKEYQGYGVGRALIDYVEKLYIEKSKHIFLCVSSFNLNAQKFYEHIGYTAVGEFKDFIIKSKSEILMHKNIE